MSLSEIDVRCFLQRLPLFSDVTAEELDMLTASASAQQAPRGTAVFNRGDPCRGFHTVLYGQIKLGFTSPDGGEKIVEIVGPGQSFGEALMFMEKPYIVSAHALDDSLLLHVSKTAVFEELERNPKFARRMLAGLSRRLHGLISDVEAYTLRSAAQRIIGYLLKGEPQRDGTRVTLTVSKRMIASRLNVTPEYLSRVLHDLTEQRLIAVSGRNVTLLKLQALRAYPG